MSSFSKNRVCFGAFEADLATEELWKYGRRLKIGGQPFGILAMLLERPGQLVTREELRARLWSADTFVDFNQGLNAAVNKLRDCLSDSAEIPKYIETLPRRGYRFIRPVTVKPAARDADKPRGSPVEADAPRESVLARQVSPVPRDLVDSLEGEPVPIGTMAVPYRWIVFTPLALLLIALSLWLLIPRHARTKTYAGGPILLGGISRPAGDPAFSPDGNRIAFRQVEGSTGPGGLVVSTLSGEQEIQLTTSEADCCPVWSPDGAWVAFSEMAGDVQTIYRISSGGGQKQKLYSLRKKYRHGDLDWSPDGRFLALSADAPNGGTQIVALSIGDKSVRPLTSPKPEEIDWGPAYSPDGAHLALVRGRSSGTAEEIFLVPAAGTVAGREAQQLTSSHSRILGPAAWTADSQSLVYSSAPNGEARLWRITAKGGLAEAVPGAGVPSWNPALPRNSTGLAYQHILAATSIWRLDLTKINQPDPRMVVISTNGRNEGPQLSPNGKKLVFMSDRAGTMEIWISDPDGSYPIKLTNLNGCGSPQWSPDGRFIAFDSVRQGRPSIFVIDVSGGEPVELAAANSENMVPRWSNDGKWIYFASDRSGEDQVWKVPASGGEPKQITHFGGFGAVESPDGKNLYYAKTRFEHPEIWQVPVNGGKESLLSSLVRPGIWANWALTNKGIFFVDDFDGHNTTLDFFDLNTRQAQAVVSLNNNSFWLSASRDGETVWYGQSAHDQSNIMIQPDFH